MSKPRVTVVIPTYNERGNIRELLGRLEKALSREGYDYEIIVVDDDSPDGTCEEVRAWGSPRVRCILRRGERDLSTAVVRGAREAKGEVVVVMDADLQHPPEVVPRLVEAVANGADLAVASRYTRGGGVAGWSRVRLLMSRAGTIIAKILVPEARRTSDPLSGFFAFRRDRVDLDRLRARGFKILVEILARHPELRVRDVPYVFERRRWGESKLSVGIGVDFLRQAWDLSPMPKFLLVGAAGAVVNLLVMWLVLRATGHVDLASLSGIEASIVFNFLLHEFYTFRFRLSRRQGSGPLRRLLLYHLVSAAAIVITYTVMKTLTTLGLTGPLTGQFLGIIAGFAANYHLSTQGVWSRIARRGPGEGVRGAG